MGKDPKNLQNSKTANHPNERQPHLPSEKPLDDEMHAYDTKDLKRLFGLPGATVRSLTRAGHLSPISRAGRLHYSFQDLIILRTASALRAAKIPARRISRTLQRMRSELPAGESLRKLSLRAHGGRIAVREGSLLWESDTGQYVLGLEIDAEPSSVRKIDPQQAPASPSQSAEEWYVTAYALEDGDQDAALEAYRQCLEADARYIDARINLGRLLHFMGRLDEAEATYRAAPSVEPLLGFNLGVLLEDLQRIDEAVLCYQQALAVDPYFADAHFNLARIFQSTDDAKRSLRHLLAYRRLTEGQRT